jgi:N-methylhydantoinase B
VAWGRHRFPPWGVDGGHEGSTNAVEIVPADGSPIVRFGKAAAYPLRKGDLVRLITGTGGGHGDPREREPDLVAGDVEDGVITEREAREVYGSG